MAVESISMDVVSYIPATDERWFYRLSRSPNDAWCWQLLDGEDGEPIGQRAGPFRDKGAAIVSAEQWIDQHQNTGGGAN